MESKFSWTQEYKRSWEEDNKNTTNMQRTNMKKFNQNRKSIIRHVLVAIDTSISIEKNDYIPSVRSAISMSIPKYVEKFKIQNPLSILNFVTCKSRFERFSKDYNQEYLLNTIGDEDFSFLNCLNQVLNY